MAMGTPPLDKTPTPIHLGVVLAHPGFAQNHRYVWRSHDQEDHLLLVVPRDVNLNWFGGSLDFLQWYACECAGAHGFHERHGGDAQALDQGGADEAGVRPGVQKDQNLELVTFPGDTRR